MFVSGKSVALGGAYENPTRVVSREDAFAAIVAFLSREHMAIGRLGWDCESGSHEADDSADGCRTLHWSGAVSFMRFMIRPVDVGRRLRVIEKVRKREGDPCLTIYGAGAALFTQRQAKVKDHHVISKRRSFAF